MSLPRRLAFQCSRLPQVALFARIAPRLTALHTGHSEATMRHPRAFTHHIGSVHAIGLCHLADLVSG